MSNHGVVAIAPDRLDAFGDALLRVADDVLRVRLDALRALELAGVPAPGEVLDLGRVSARLRELGHDTRRRLGIVRRLAWEDAPMPTSLLVDREVLPPYRSITAVEALLAAGADLRPHDVARYLEPVLAAASDDMEAAAAVERLGVEGLRHLYQLALREATALPADEREAAVFDRTEAITALVVAASRTVDRPGGLSRRAVDELFPGIDPPQDDGRTPQHAAGVASDILTAAGAGQYLASAAQRAVTGGVATVLTRAGRLLAIGGFIAGVIDGLATGDLGTVGEATFNAGIGVVASLAGGPVGWAIAGFGVLVSLVAAVGRLPGPPPARTYPSDRPSPGGHGSETWLTGSGAPVAPNGR